MTGTEAELVAALLQAVRRLHFGAGDPAYRHRPCDVCALVTRAERELGPLPAPPRLLPPPGPLPGSRLRGR